MNRLIGPEWAAQRTGRQVLIAVVLAAVAISLRWALTPWLGEHHEFLPGYAAVAAATWLATWRAGLLVSIASLAAVALPLLARPRAPSQPLQDATSIIAFALVSALLVYMTHHASRRMHALSNEVDRLDRADHKKSDFLALIAHELRNPLSALTVGGSLIRSGRLDKSSLRGTWEMMERQTDHMKRLISDLLDVARIEQGKIILQRERLRVASLVDQAIADANPYTVARQQRIAVSTEGEPGEAYVDSLRIGQVLGNLLHNASKFSPQGAAIGVTVRASADDVRISVKDSGIGIPPGALDAIFDSFVQLEPKGGRPQGLGLGLALCRKLIEMHDGTVTARSDGPGRGAEFSIAFPRALAADPLVTIGDPPEGCGDTQPAPAADDGTRLRLLVVDDNRDAADSLAMLLQMMGHIATTASDGLAALDAARQEQPDFVFLDIGLPDMSGHEVAMRLRSQITGKQPVLVALTGWGSENDRRLSRRHGFDAHLTKPVSLEQIEEALALKTRRPVTIAADPASEFAM